MIPQHKGLQLEEPLIFEQGATGRCGVDLVDLKILPPLSSSGEAQPRPGDPELVLDSRFRGNDNGNYRLGTLKPRTAVGLPGLSEPQVVRHYTRLSQKNYSIDAGLYPLGSCTMKHNPRLNEKMARLPGFGDIHPLQPISTVQGALALMDQLAQWLLTLTGMAAVSLTPGAGAHGEACGMIAIRAALEAKGQSIAQGRTKVLVPESAHGTNPATAAALGFTVESVPGDARGRVDLAAMKAQLGPDVAAIMLTNPNTCGLFESDIVEIAKAVHEAGGYFYGDGANFNAIAGRVRPADLGIDAMHINLHKTFSTPHGGGGPGSGPVVFSEALAPFAPLPYVRAENGTFRLVEQAEGSEFGRMKAFHGQMGMFVRALSYMLSHGLDGIKQASEDAVLNANYVMARLADAMSPAFDGPCMHEALFDDRFLKDTGITTLDFAKAMLDEGYHPMTVYFPLVVHGAMLVEPTESEAKESLDHFIATLRRLAEKAKTGDAEFFQQAPRHTPRRRLDETRAARTPILRWKPNAAQA
jgi:glycine dehydrogenase subunit 2